MNRSSELGVALLVHPDQVANFDSCVTLPADPDGVGGLVGVLGHECAPLGRGRRSGRSSSTSSLIGGCHHMGATRATADLGAGMVDGEGRAALRAMRIVAS